MDNLRLLHYSADLNRLSHNILAIPAAVSDSRTNLSLAEDPSNIGGRFVVVSEEQKFNFKSRRKFYANSVLLDDLLSAVEWFREYPGARIVLKIDIQGHECFAVRGAREFLGKLRVSEIFMKWEEIRKAKNKNPR